MPTPHIAVCICTYKRPVLLHQLLDKLRKQRTEGLFSYSVVVADNDSAQSAQEVVNAFASTAQIPVTYCVEPRQNIAMVRNKSLLHSEGDFIAFIDDDETPTENWLYNLFKAHVDYDVDCVFGPVQPVFEKEPPDWAKRGKFFDRPTHPTGFKISWGEARTGNVLFRRSILEGVENPFSLEFDAAGEDVDFFRRMMEKGCTLVWCNEAVVHEVVPASRCSRAYLLKRAMLRGSNFPKHPTHRLRNIAKSLVAVPCYTLALPVIALFGQATALTYLIKLLDHTSRLLAFLGLKLIPRRGAM